MATVNSTKPATKREFIGRAWKNAVKAGDRQGTEFISLSLDKGVDITLNGGDRMLLWPNKKREGKADADFRVSVEVAA